MAGARELLLAERERTLRRMAALEREFAGIAEAAGSAGADDEHDPEGATLACVRCAAPGYSARSANAVRVLAAQPAGSSAPATAMTSPDTASRTISNG
jgi:hypothetical protein